MKRLRSTGRWILTGLFVALALHQVPPEQFLLHLKGVDLGWVAASAALMACIVLVNAWKWQMLLEVQGVHPGYLRLLYHYAVGYFFNSFLTGTGDLKRAADLGSEEGRSREVFASVLAERWTGVMGQLGLACGTLLLACLGYPVLQPLLAFSAGLGAVLAAAYLWLERSRPARARSGDGLLAVVGSWVAGVRHSLGAYRGARAVLWRALGISFAGPVLLVLIHWTLGRALHLELPLAALFLFVPTISVFAQLPISVNGWGLQDVSMIGLLALAGVLGGEAMALSVAFHLLRLAVGGTGGLLFVLAPDLGRDRSSVRAVAQ